MTALHQTSTTYKKYTTDQLFGDRLIIRQPVSGYRFTVDPVILSHFVNPAKYAHVVDLGSGSGIIPLILAYLHPTIRITGVEIQKKLADLALENISLNRLDDHIELIHGNMTDRDVIKKLKQVSLVVSNPPYIPLGSGRLNPDPEKAMSRHEIAISLETLVETASDLLGTGGKFAVVLPANRMSELKNILDSMFFFPTRIRFIHTLKKEHPKRVLVESVKEVPCTAENIQPLFIYDENGCYSSEMEQFFNKKPVENTH